MPEEFGFDTFSIGVGDEVGGSQACGRAVAGFAAEGTAGAAGQDGGAAVAPEAGPRRPG